MKKHLTQVDKTLKIVRRSRHRGMFTTDVIREGLKVGIGCVDRRLRDLRFLGQVISVMVPGKRTRLWIAADYL